MFFCAGIKTENSALARIFRPGFINMFVLKILLSFFAITVIQLVCTNGAWAWGPAIHTAIACTILNDLSSILPAIASVIQSFPLEYIYGNMAADFFIGKGQKKKDGHSHNWETGQSILNEVRDEQEAAYAYGFLSHLAADIAAHNYFVPDLIHRIYTWKKMGHIYSEAVADRFMGPVYIHMAREVLSTEGLDCDRLLKSAVKLNIYGLKAKKRIFTQTVKISDYLYCFPQVPSITRNSRYMISPDYLDIMTGLSYRLVKHVLSHPDTSPCLAYDPIGSRNISLASQNGIMSKLFNNNYPQYRFPVDQELLEL
jgi:hypothetical protein